MAILTYPLNGVIYDAEDVEVYMCTRTSGVFAQDGHFPASATGGRVVTIGPGLAWMQNEEFHGKAVYNPEDVELTIGEADSYQDRIDRIVLQFDKLLNQTTLLVKEGTPASSPKAPDIERDELIYELGLYTVRVPASSISVSDANISCTFLDDSVCGIMEDAVTQIPTQELYDQWYAWFSQIQTDTTNFENQFNAWFEDIKEQAEKNMEENEEEFKEWMTNAQDEFDVWFANLEYVLDGDVAGHLELEIEKAQSSADESIEMLMSGVARGFLMDGNGNAIFATNDDESSDDPSILGEAIVGVNTVTSVTKGIILEWKICNCENEASTSSGGNVSRSEIVDIVYPVGSIYIAANSMSPAVLFGGTWSQISDRFLLAAGSSYSAGDTGGAATVTLSESQIPSHTHSLPSHSHSIPSHTHSLPSHTHSLPSHTHSLPSHTHSIPSLSGTAASAGSHTHTYRDVTGEEYGIESGPLYGVYGSYDSNATGSAGAHTHSVTTTASTTGSTSGTSGSTSGTSGSTSGTSGSYSGTTGTQTGTSGSTGSGSSHNNMPPYLAVYMWQRVA